MSAAQAARDAPAPEPEPPGGKASGSPVDVAVAVEDERWRDLDPRLEPRLAGLARVAVTAVRPDGPPCELGIVLADDRLVHQLNRQYRGQDRPTNVLSFALTEGEGPAIGPPVQLGDVIVAFETVMAEARRDRRTPIDHLQHLVVHGILHLLGHDHETEAEAARMERQEVEILALVGVADPYGPDPTDASAAAAPAEGESGLPPNRT